MSRPHYCDYEAITIDESKSNETSTKAVVPGILTEDQKTALKRDIAAKTAAKKNVTTTSQATSATKGQEAALLVSKLGLSATDSSASKSINTRDVNGCKIDLKDCNVQIAIFQYIPINFQAGWTLIKKCYEAAQRKVIAMDKKKIVEEVQAHSTISFSLFCLILFGSIASGVVMNYLKYELEIPLPAIQTAVMLIVCLGSHNFLRFRPEAVMILTTIATVLVGFMDVEDKFVSSRDPSRMNQDFYQELDLNLHKMKQNHTLLNLLFSGRKAVDSCKANLNGRDCAHDMEEFEEVKNLTMRALHNVMLQEKIVPRRNARYKLKGEFFKETNFESTLSKAPKEYAKSGDYSSKDFVATYEEDVSSLAALKVQDGMAYYFGMSRKLQLQKSAYNSLESVNRFAMLTGPFDSFVFRDYTSTVGKVKIGLLVFTHALNWLFPEQVAMESFDNKVGSTWVSNGEIDMCMIKRCHTNKPIKPSPVDTYVQPKNVTKPEDCPNEFLNLTWNFNICDKLKTKCFSELEFFNNEAPDTSDVMCPTKCQNVYWKEENKTEQACSSPSNLHFNAYKDKDYIDVTFVPDNTSAFLNFTDRKSVV